MSNNTGKHKALNIQDILRAEDIKRWTIICTTKQQSLAEHTFNVIAISRAICKKLGVTDILVMKYAFDHDLDEILTGDIPTPAKDTLKLPDMYCGGSKEECTVSEIAIVGLADMIEALRFINVHGLGRLAAQVMDGLIDRLNQRIALYAFTIPGLEEAVGEVIDDIEHGDFIGE